MTIFLKKLLSYFTHQILNYFYITGKPKYLNPIYYFRQIKNKTEEKKFRKIFKNQFFLLNQITTGCSYIDYMKIFNLVLNLKPKYICEFGSGISTLIAAHALKINNAKFKISGKIISFEEDKYYFDNTKEMINVSGLDKFIELNLSKVKYLKYLNYTGVYYDNFDFNKEYQIFIIDGPQLKSKNGIKPFNADLYNYHKKNPYLEFTAFLDKRMHTYNILKTILPNLDFYYNNIDESSLIKNKLKK